MYVHPSIHHEIGRLRRAELLAAADRRRLARAAGPLATQRRAPRSLPAGSAREVERLWSDVWPPAWPHTREGGTP
jgi:hypothetical protein